MSADNPSDTSDNPKQQHRPITPKIVIIDKSNTSARRLRVLEIAKVSWFAVLVIMVLES